MVDYNNPNQNSSIVTGGQQIISPPPSVDPSVGRETDDVNICEKKCEYKWWRYIKDPNDPTSIILDPNTETAKQLKLLDKKLTECKKKYDKGLDQLIKICENVCEESGQEIIADDLQKTWFPCNKPCNRDSPDGWMYCPGRLRDCPYGPTSCVGQCVKSKIRNLWNGFIETYSYEYQFTNGQHLHNTQKTIMWKFPKLKTTLPRDNPNSVNSCILSMCDKSTDKDSFWPPDQVWRHGGHFTDQQAVDQWKTQGPIPNNDVIWRGGWGPTPSYGNVVSTGYTPEPYQSFGCCMSNINEKFLHDALSLLNYPLHWQHRCMYPSCSYRSCDPALGMWWWAFFTADMYLDLIDYNYILERLKRQMEINGFVMSLLCKDECCPIDNPYCRSGPDPNQCPDGPCIQIRDSG